MRKIIAGVLAGNSLPGSSLRAPDGAAGDFSRAEDVIKYTPDWQGKDFLTAGPRCPMTFWTA